MDQEGLNHDLSHTTQTPPENEVTVQQMLDRAAYVLPEVEALKLKLGNAPEHSNSDRTASTYHSKADSAVNEIGESAYNLYGNEGNKFPAEKAKVPSLSSCETFKTPIGTLQLMKQMTSVEVVGPTGITLEGVLFKECVMVCICHGCFLSPADFVRHAGWGTVPNPIEYIKVLR